MAKRAPVEPAEVRAVVLRSLAAGTDPDDLRLELITFQRDHAHTMAEVLLELATDALTLSNASRAHPIDYQDLLKSHLQEYD